MVKELEDKSCDMEEQQAETASQVESNLMNINLNRDNIETNMKDRKCS